MWARGMVISPQSPPAEEAQCVDNKEPRKVNVALSLLTFFGIAGGTIAIAFPDPHALVLIWMFPLGLCAFFRPNQPSISSGILMTILILASYGIYVALLIACARA